MMQEALLLTEARLDYTKQMMKGGYKSTKSSNLMAQKQINKL